MNIILKLTHLPSLPCYILSLCKFPFDYTTQRFYVAEGIVVAMSIITKYTQGARFVCSEETCQFSEGILVSLNSNSFIFKPNFKVYNFVLDTIFHFPCGFIY